jgi:membrane protein YqaA with SNARE-associated domain
MNRKSKIFWTVFLMILVFLILIISLSYNAVNSFIEKNVQAYGYPAVFVFSFLCDIIDQPIVVEIPSVLGVAYGLNVLYVFLFAVSGMSIIGIINFNIGRIFFRNKPSSICSTKKYNNYCRLFNKYGKLSLLIAALTPIPYVAFVWLSGAFGMKFRDFFIFGTLAKAFRLGFFLLAFKLAFL